MTDSVLSEAEIVELSGGYKRPCDQLRSLQSRGYYRAWRSPLTGRVVLERAHAEAVASGATLMNTPAANDSRPRPKLRESTHAQRPGTARARVFEGQVALPGRR